MTSVPLIHTSWLQPFAEFFARRGGSLGRYLEGAKIELSQVTDGESWITKRQLYRFLNAAAVGEKMPELGFLVGETITPDSLGGISVAMADATTLGEAIRTFCLLINRSSEENRSWLEERGDGEVWLFNQTTNPFPADRRISDHAGLMSMVNLVRLAGGADWYPSHAALQTRSTSAFRKAQGLRACVFEFDHHATGFPFPAAWLLSPVSLHAPSPTRSVSADLLEGDEELADKLKRLLGATLGVGGISPTINLMAELCGTSTRTLHRRLGEEGASYRRILDEVRVDRAKRELRGSQISIKQLAFELGYSGSNNFIRAFRRMTGQTPTQYRQAKGG